MKSFLGNFYRHLAIFSGHTVCGPDNGLCYTLVVKALNKVLLKVNYANRDQPNLLYKTLPQIGSRDDL